MTDVARLIRYAEAFIGAPYEYGGDDPLSGFDCSGLVCELLRAAGLVPYDYRTNAQGLHDHLLKRYRTADPCAGAVAFFGRDSATVTHVGFCVDGYTMIEAGGGGSTTTDTAEASRRNAFVRMRPVRSRRDFLYTVGVNYGG